MASKPRVLIVDDDPVIRRLLEVNFRLEGFDVESASDGGATIEKARSFGPDAIVMDVMMPAMDGWEVCRRLKRDERFSGTPVILLSARPEDAPRGLDAPPVAAYVGKPFDPEDLVTVVRRAIAR